MGKGDKPRDVDPSKWDRNWDRIFKPIPRCKKREEGFPDRSAEDPPSQSRQNR